eukprot:scaffold8.g1468.t1
MSDHCRPIEAKLEGASPTPTQAKRRRVSAPARAAGGGGSGAGGTPPRASAADTVVVGIDLGTTNSCVAVVEGGAPVVVPGADGATTPSVVAFGPDGAVLVGALAKRQAAANPRNTFYSVKRLIGQRGEALEQQAARVAYDVAADEEGDVVLACDASESGAVYPEEVSACVVGTLLDAAAKFAGRGVAKAVISVPAYFGDAQREATVAAGRLAGLEAVKLEDQTVLVFDLGGGTFDVSLLEVGGGVIEVLSTGGDPLLGGDDWDNAIVEWLVREHVEPAGADASDPRIRANLKAVAEAAKIQLSTQERVVIRMPLGAGVEAVLTRQLFEGLTADLFRRARQPLDAACWQAGVDLGTVQKEYEEAVRNAQREKGAARRRGGARRGGPRGAAAAAAAAAGPAIRPKRRAPVGEVLLVGGATRMPAVRRFVRNMTGLEAKEFLVDPDLAVALGAAVQAGIYEGQVADLMVMDVWQAALMRAYARQAERERRAAEGPGEGAEGAAEEEAAAASEGSDDEWGLEGLEQRPGELSSVENDLRRAFRAGTTADNFAQNVVRAFLKGAMVIQEERGAVPEAAAQAVLVQSEDLAASGTPVVRGHDFDAGCDLDGLLGSMLHTGLQATALGQAIAEVNRMLRWRLSDEPLAEDDVLPDPAARAGVKTKIFLGYTSNLVSSGVREHIRFLVQHRLVDVLVTTAGGVEEDLIKLRGADLRRRGLNRIGNMLVPNSNYCAFEDWVVPILDAMLEEQRRDGVRWTPSRMIERLGREVNDPSSICYWAAANGIPIFCPALTDGSLGDMLYFHTYKSPGLMLDIVQDIRLMNDQALKAAPRKTGAVILGGGARRTAPPRSAPRLRRRVLRRVPKHHICNANLMRNGADFAVFLNTAQEFDGSDSGARPDEAVSWGKIRTDAQPVKVYGDASILFPLLVSQTFAKVVQREAEAAGQQQQQQQQQQKQPPTANGAPA